MGVFSSRHTERRQLLTFYRPWYRRPLVLLFLLLPVLAVARLALTPLAWYQTKRVLSELPEYDISFSSMSIALLGKQVIFRNVKVHHRADSRRDDRSAVASIPFVQVEGPMLRWLRGGPVEQITLLDPVFRLRTHDRFTISPQARAVWNQAVSRLPLKQINVLRIHKATLISEAQADGGLSPQDRPLFRDLDATVKGLGFGASAMSDAVHAQIDRGLFLGSGITKGQVTLTPDGSRSWDFEGDLLLAGLDLPDIYGHALAPEPPQTPPRGKLRVKATFRAKAGLLTAELEPDVSKDPTSPAFTPEVLAALEQKVTRTTGMRVWTDGARLQAGLPAAMAPVRLAAVVPALVLAAAAHVLMPPPPAAPCVPRLAQLEQGASGGAVHPGEGTVPGGSNLPECPDPLAPSQGSQVGTTDAAMVGVPGAQAGAAMGAP